MSIVDRAAEFAEKAHATQLRKYTMEKYFVHLCEVAATVAKHGLSDNAIAASYLHDTMEDTPTTHEQLRDVFGPEIAGYVYDLTDEPAGPCTNRAKRHAKNIDRLAYACGEVQSIKCADLISNTASIVRFDPDFARVYLPEKRQILTAMKRALPAIHREAMTTLERAERELYYLTKQRA